MLRNLLDGPHLLVILLVILLLFGGKKLPEAARGLGRSMRIFKSEVKEMREDDEDRPREPLEGRVVDDRPGTTASGPSGRAERTGASPVDDIDGARERGERRRGA